LTEIHELLRAACLFLLAGQDGWLTGAAPGQFVELANNARWAEARRGASIEAHRAGRQVALFLVAGGLIRPGTLTSRGQSAELPTAWVAEFVPLEGSTTDVLEQVDNYLGRIGDDPTWFGWDLRFENTSLGNSVAHELEGIREALGL